MASSLCGGSIHHSLSSVRLQQDRNLRSDQPSSCSMVINIPRRVRGRVVNSVSRGKIVNSSSAAVAETRSPRRNRRGGDRKGSETAAATAYERVDEWMKDSVTEIVKNLREAPLLVHVYGGDEEERRMETEKRVEEENWDTLKGKWEAGEAPSPEGVIFVEELMDDGGVDGGDNGGEYSVSKDGITRAWGLVVQGKGEECGPACYLLKTSKVNVGSGYGLGMGMGCTHFCLVRVKSFRETAKSQLKNSWLLQAQMQGLGR
ncbi:PREDICTED: uncharacterized protein LOC101305600 [Fragaria vesca subsp. vesca]|uniref:uncharacterized protein LOC101305600 n=1 Tax=Fragaria vesca subsp. vesca TaxID=101020 RepID=UPI0002C31185|nr:PREDICTED: uncharacterized protein LOC101305600 [Fragaria vesca subsp. vesca]